MRRRMSKQEKHDADAEQAKTEAHDKSAESEARGSEQESSQAPSQASSQAPSTEAEAEAGKAEDQLRRAMADLANMRKRQAKERDEARQRAIEGMSAELLPVLDNFYLALSAHEQSADTDASAEVKNMLDGLVMVRGLLEGTLERHGVSAIAADGQVFDPNRHEAVGVEADTDADDGTIVRVVQRGYTIGDKVLRASRVIVAGAPTQADPEREVEGGGD